MSKKIDCPECSSEIEKDNTSCPECGYPLDDEAKESQALSNTEISNSTQNSENESSYVYLILTFLAGIVIGGAIGIGLAGFYGLDFRQLSDIQKTWMMDKTSNIDIDDPNYPLEHIESGYKLIERDGEWVEWGWKYTVKNNSSNPLVVGITYKLEDVDGFTLDKDSKDTKNGIPSRTDKDNWKYVGPNQQVTIRDTDKIKYEKIDRIVDSSWLINYKRR